MKIVMFKLVSGDVILGKIDQEVSVTDTDAEEIMVEKPMQLMLDPTQGGVGMIPYDAIFCQIEPQEHTFRTKDIMHEMPVHETFEEAYIKQTTGIEINTEAPIELGVA